MATAANILSSDNWCLADFCDNSSPFDPTATGEQLSAADSSPAITDSAAPDIDGPADKTVRTEPSGAVPEPNAAATGTDRRCNIPASGRGPTESK